MIDVVGAIVLGAFAVITPGALILSSPLDRRTRIQLLALSAFWLVLVAGLAAAGVFTSLGVPAIGVAVVAPVVIGFVSAGRDTVARRLALGIPLATFVLVNVGRLLGAFFLALHEQGRLPTTFALSAGWGDIAVALLAIPVAWLAHRRAPGWQTATLAWNAVGFLDLTAAVSLGVGSTPGSPIRFIYEDAVPGTMATLPWAVIPGFLVPLYLLTHLAVFARLLWQGDPGPSRVALHAGH